MSERRRIKGRRAEDRIAARIIGALRLGSLIVAAAAGFFVAGAAALITARSAWIDIVNAFWKK